MENQTNQKEIDGISAIVFEQYERIRGSGLTNMFDVGTVKRIADKMCFDELSKEIAEKNYSKILKNYSKAKAEGII